MEKTNKFMSRPKQETLETYPETLGNPWETPPETLREPFSSSPRTQRDACAGCGSRNSSDTNGGAEADFGIKGAVSATTSPHFSIKKPGFSNSGETPSSLNQTGGSCLLNLNNPRRRLMHQPTGKILETHAGSNSKGLWAQTDHGA